MNSSVICRKDTPSSLSSQSELVFQPGNHHLKIASLNHGLIIRADERQITHSELESQLAALPRLQVNLGKALEPFAWRRHRSDHIAHVNRHDLFAGALAGVLDRHGDAHLAAARDRLLVEFQIAIGKGRITQARAEEELWFISRIAESGVVRFPGFMIVSQ